MKHSRLIKALIPTRFLPPPVSSEHFSRLQRTVTAKKASMLLQVPFNPDLGALLNVIARFNAKYT